MVTTRAASIPQSPAVRVARQIGHLLGPGERPLAIDEPLGPMQRREMGLERGLVGEVGMIAEELQAAGVALQPTVREAAARRSPATLLVSGSDLRGGRAVRCAGPNAAAAGDPQPMDDGRACVVSRRGPKYSPPR
jgi:hypothetical protein